VTLKKPTSQIRLRFENKAFYEEIGFMVFSGSFTDGGLCLMSRCDLKRSKGTTELEPG
jgi:hypothetical protein